MDECKPLPLSSRPPKVKMGRRPVGAVLHDTSATDPVVEGRS